MEYKNNKTANRRRYKSRYHSPHNYKTKRSKSENRAAILIAIATFVVLASLVLVFTFGDNIYAFLDRTIHPSILPNATTATEEATAAPTEPATQAPTAAPTEPPTDAAQQSEEFLSLLRAAGLESSRPEGSQMIFVQASGTSATVYTYEKGDDGVWTAKFDPIQGYVGEGGIAENVGPYDNTTPTGTYQIEFAFGTNGDPGTSLTYYTVQYGMRWITDPASINYNRMVDADAYVIDWNDCQWLHEYTRSYPYAVVFDYNRNPVDAAKGCARFLHVGYAPTYGGVGIAESDLYNVLMWLRPDTAATISIF